jgi:LemA protein
MAFERDVLTAVTTARAAFSPTAPIASQGVTAAETTRAVRTLFAAVERYPEVRSAENVLALQAGIERIESMLADRRELYNDQVYRFNARIGQVPAVLLAGWLGWRPRPSFDAGPGVGTPPPGLTDATAGSPDGPPVA